MNSQQKVKKEPEHAPEANGHAAAVEELDALQMRIDELEQQVGDGHHEVSLCSIQCSQ